MNIVEIFMRPRSKVSPRIPTLKWFKIVEVRVICSLCKKEEEKPLLEKMRSHRDSTPTMVTSHLHVPQPDLGAFPAKHSATVSQLRGITAHAAALDRHHRPGDGLAPRCGYSAAAALRLPGARRDVVPEGAVGGLKASAYQGNGTPVVKRSVFFEYALFRDGYLIAPLGYKCAAWDGQKKEGVISPPIIFLP